MTKRTNGLIQTCKRILRRVRPAVPPKDFTGTFDYWRDRYTQGGDSGAGSYNHLARFKADVLNAFVLEHRIATVIEFGCGDGNQLRYANYPSYYGLDISREAIARCVQIHRADVSKNFALLNDYHGETADLALSLDVIFHLVEDEIFDEYMQRLFAAAKRLVIIYSSDTDDNSLKSAPHVRHRRFSRWIAENAKDWKLVKTIKNKFTYDGDYTRTSFCDFFIYARTDD